MPNIVEIIHNYMPWTKKLGRKDYEEPSGADVIDEIAQLVEEKTLPDGKIKKLKAGAFLVCPHCGHDGRKQGKNGRGFRYLEDVVNHREVKGFDKNGTLIVASLYELGEGYDDGDNARVECRGCLGEFRIPESVMYDFE